MGKGKGLGSIRTPWGSPLDGMIGMNNCMIAVLTLFSNYEGDSYRQKIIEPRT